MTDSESPLDEMLRALANTHRRRLLVVLSERDRRDDDELHVLDAVHAGERGSERLRAELFHNHLPRLEEAGFIRWDRETCTAAKGPRFEELRPLLELMDDRADELPDWL